MSTKVVVQLELKTTFLAMTLVFLELTTKLVQLAFLPEKSKGDWPSGAVLVQAEAHDPSPYKGEESHRQQLKACWRRSSKCAFQNS